MECSIQGCPGEYVGRRIVHVVMRGGEVVVVEGVPAEVCDVCSDTLLAPETIRRLEALASSQGKARKQAPVLEYA